MSHQCRLTPPYNAFQPTGLIQDACCDFETVESVNDNLYTGLNSLVDKPFFRYHKVRSHYYPFRSNRLTLRQPERWRTETHLFPQLLTRSFSQVDLLRECPFWQEDGSCMNIACAVETTTEVKPFVLSRRLFSAHSPS